MSAHEQMPVTWNVIQGVSKAAVPPVSWDPNISSVVADTSAPGFALAEQEQKGPVLKLANYPQMDDPGNWSTGKV